MLKKFAETLKMIRIEHSIFALPFALVASFLAAEGFPPLRIISLVILALIFARSAAMAFNRYLDAELDAKNPRTKERSIPAGRLSKQYALIFTIFSSIFFIATCFFINQIAIICSPLILAVLLGYSYTKRFTKYCHFFLGLALGLSPIGAWVAVTGEFALTPILLGFAVMIWTAGFDIIYACQDIQFDRNNALYSIPAKVGINNSLMLSRVLHLSMVAILFYIGEKHELGTKYSIGLALVVLCLVYEHTLVWGGRLEKVNLSFFTLNGIVSVIFGITSIASILT